jgi:RNA polymerase sigma factor (sigma-70 family)
MPVDDAAALGELYERYAGKIYLYIRFHVGDQETAQDLFSVVFIKALQAMRAHKTWQRSALGWLRGIAHNAIMDYFRRPQQGRDLPLGEEIVSTLDNPVATVESMLISEAVRDAMHYLTAGQGRVVALVYAEGMSNAEAAEALGKTEGSVKSMRLRALVVLREHMRIEEVGE